MLRYQIGGGTNFSAALQTGQAVIEQNWTTERFVTIKPVTHPPPLFVKKNVYAIQNTSHDLPV
jgi:hypothetical protein